MLTIHKNGRQVCKICKSCIPKRLPRLNVGNMETNDENDYFRKRRMCGKCIKETVESYKKEQIKNIIDWENKIANEQLEIEKLSEEEIQNKLEFESLPDSKTFCKCCNLEIPENIPIIIVKGYLRNKFICGKCILRAYRLLPRKLYISEELYNKKMMIDNLGGV